MSHQPQNVGIKALELYFPSQCLSQKDFEVHQGVSAGKYTIGLGQSHMSFCDDTEDVCSLALTAVSSLLRKYNIDPNTIGRLEVGTESMIDKAKSVKTVLTQLFEPSGNTSLEGADTYNACYGGTNALLNAVNWVESRGWDGRDAIVVAGDISIYKEPAARPTGGAGCVAMLVGPNAILALEPGMRGVYMSHAYDFYKPNLSSEYPLVDGQMSIGSYLSAVDACGKDYRKRASKLQPIPGNGVLGLLIDSFDFLVFHTPNCKQVSKAYGRLLYGDFVESPNHPDFKEVPANLRSLLYQESLYSKELEKYFIGLSNERFENRVRAGTIVPNLCGNMYCASVYGALISLLCNTDAAALTGKRLGLFSYGSGLASTLFSLKVTGDVGEMVKKLDLQARLDSRIVVSSEEYDAACRLREEAYGQKSFVPKGDASKIASGAYYLKEVDERFRRTYAQKQ